MIRLTMALAALATAAQSGKNEEKPQYPPFTVVIIARTAGTPDVERQAFERGLKQLKGYAVLVRKAPWPQDRTYEEFIFEISGEKKFDPTPLWQTFINVKVKTYSLTVTGTLSMEAQTKKLFVTSYSGKTKVKLMNRPKKSFDNPDDKVEDIVSRLAEKMQVDGRVCFTVTGELFNSGGALAILLKTFEEAPPPPPPPKGKEPKK